MYITLSLDNEQCIRQYKISIRQKHCRYCETECSRIFFRHCRERWMRGGVGEVYEINRVRTRRRATTLVLIARQRGSRGTSIVMDSSPFKFRVDSSKNQSSSEGSRATKPVNVAASLSELADKLNRLDREFDCCAIEISCTLHTRELLIHRIFTVIKTLERKLDYYEHALDVREKLNAASLELRDENLDDEREQTLQETIEKLTEMEEDFGETEHGVGICHTKCRLFETKLNDLMDANEAEHERLIEKIIKIKTSREKILEKYFEVLASVGSIEGELRDMRLN